MKMFVRPFHEATVCKALAYGLSLVKFKLYGVSYGANLRAAKVSILNEGEIVIGNGVLLRSNPGGSVYNCGLRTYYPESRIEIGDNVKIAGAVIHCNCLVQIGAHSRIGPGVILCDNDSHPPTLSIAGRFDRPPEAPIRIGQNVWLGMRTIVLKGVTIGDNTIVAAGSIVTRDLPPNVLAAGAPAKSLRPLK